MELQQYYLFEGLRFFFQSLKFKSCLFSSTDIQKNCISYLQDIAAGFSNIRIQGRTDGRKIKENAETLVYCHKGSFEVEGTQEHKAHFMRFTGSNTWQNLIRSSIDVISGEAD